MVNNHRKNYHGVLTILLTLTLTNVRRIIYYKLTNSILSVEFYSTKLEIYSIK